MVLKFVNIGLRVLLAVLGAVVTGLSATLAKHQVYGSVPGQTSFGTFAGGLGIVVSLIGLAAIFVAFIPSILVIAIDAVSTVIYLAAGIVLAAYMSMKGIDCNTQSIDGALALLEFPLFNGGTLKDGDLVWYGVMDGHSTGHDVGPDLKSRCVRTQSDYAVMFVAAAFTAGVLALSVLQRRKERQSYV